jgi:hypothetical protein
MQTWQCVGCGEKILERSRELIPALTEHAKVCNAAKRSNKPAIFEHVGVAQTWQQTRAMARASARKRTVYALRTKTTLRKLAVRPVSRTTKKTGARA